MSLAPNTASNTDAETNGSGAASSARASSSGAAPEPTAADLQTLLSKMRAAARKAGPPDYDTRIELLDKLERVLLARKDDIAKAIEKDFGTRSRHESLIAEVLFTVNEIKHTRAHLHE